MSRDFRRSASAARQVAALAAVVFSFAGGFSLFLSVFYATKASRPVALVFLAVGALLWLILYLCSRHPRTLRAPALSLAASFLLFVSVTILLHVFRHPEVTSWRDIVLLLCSGVGFALVWRIVLRDARSALRMPPKI
jgi:hypothetical protein